MGGIVAFATAYGIGANEVANCFGMVVMERSTHPVYHFPTQAHRLAPEPSLYGRQSSSPLCVNWLARCCWAVASPKPSNLALQTPQTLPPHQPC